MHTHAHTQLGLKTTDLEIISKAISLWLLRASIEKLIITHAMHQQTLRKTIKEQTTKEGDWMGDRDRERQRKRENSRILVTWHQLLVRSGQGQRSAVSNPPCPLP